MATWSNHWIPDLEFGQAVAQFLDRERIHVDAYMEELAKHAPFRKDQRLPLSPACTSPDRNLDLP